MIFHNTIVQFIAFLLPGKNLRHAFRAKYKRKTKYEKLIEENKKLLQLIKSATQKINELEGYIYANIRVAPLPSDSPVNYGKPSIYLSVACIAKNEGPYIREWIEYHKIVGVERFYFYDNDSSDNTREVLEPYIRLGVVIYRRIEGRGMQLKVYADAVYNYRYETTWMALIDLDEYIVPIEKDNLQDVLKEYEQYPGLAVKWVCFDCNGHDEKPNDLGGMVTANYTRVLKNYNHPFNNPFKSIIRPSFVAAINGAHSCIYFKNRRAVNESFKEIPIGKESDPLGSVKKIRINHYYSKSITEFKMKITRGNMMISRTYKDDDPRVVFKDETTQDKEIQKFLPKLNNALHITAIN